MDRIMYLMKNRGPDSWILCHSCAGSGPFSLFPCRICTPIDEVVRILDDPSTHGVDRSPLREYLPGECCHLSIKDSGICSHTAGYLIT